MKAYEHLARLLADAGVTTVFGVMGDGNMHWVCAYRDLPGCAWRPAWHEAGAVWMADGYAAAADRVGVATVTMGPGLAQSLAALTTAVRTRRPLVLVTAELSRTVPPQAQAAAQAEWVHACGARYVRVDTADALPAAVASALASAASGEPCVLAVGIDVFGRPAAAALASAARPAAVAGPAPARVPAGVDDAARLIGASRAPLVVVGRGVLAAGCLRDLLDLGRCCGAAFTTTIGGRTALPGEPFDLGVTGMMAGPLARELAAAADLLLVVGAALDRYNTDGGALVRGKQVIRVDHRAAADLWDGEAARVVHVTGDAGAAVRALAERVAPSPAGTDGLRTPEVAARLRREQQRQADLAASPTADGPNPWAVVGVLNQTLPSDAYVVVGIGHFWYFVAPYLDPAPARRFHFGSGFALIGQALPLSIGAAIALAESGHARQVIAVEGDGSIAMNIQELQAAVRHGVDLLVVVLNNRSYGSEYHKLGLAGLDAAAGNFDDTPFDFAAVAQAMGATTARATDLPSLRAAMGELVAARGVRLLDVAIARSVMSEVYERQHARPAQSR